MEYLTSKGKYSNCGGRKTGNPDSFHANLMNYPTAELRGIFYLKKRRVTIIKIKGET
jgi:hypothetical protein